MYQCGPCSLGLPLRFGLEPHFIPELALNDFFGVTRNINQVPMQIRGTNARNCRVSLDIFREIAVDGFDAGPRLILASRDGMQPKQVDGGLLFIAQLKFQTVVFFAKFFIQFQDAVIGEMPDHPFFEVVHPGGRVQLFVVRDDGTLTVPSQ